LRVFLLSFFSKETSFASSYWSQCTALPWYFHLNTTIKRCTMRPFAMCMKPLWYTGTQCPCNERPATCIKADSFFWKVSWF
jgi:hypothetical protein